MDYTEAVEILQVKIESRATIKRVDKLLKNPKTTTFEKNGLRKLKEKAKEEFRAAHRKFDMAGRVINEYESYNSRKLPGIK